MGTYEHTHNTYSVEKDQIITLTQIYILKHKAFGIIYLVHCDAKRKIRGILLASTVNKVYDTESFVF